MKGLECVFWLSWIAIGYTYIGFPILLAVIARIKPRNATSCPPKFATEALPAVAMIVAAYNEEGVITEKLQNTWQLTYPAAKTTVYVGSDGSSDSTNQLLSACTDSRLTARCFEERRGKISVLNDLVAEASADIIVFSDANTKLCPEAVTALVNHFADPTIGCVSGVLQLEQDGGVSGEGFYWKYENWIKNNESALGFLIGCNGGLFAIRKSLYEPLPASTIVEDFVLSMRVLERGFRVIIEPAARATEPACASAREEMKRKIRIGAGNWQALTLNKAVLNPKFGLRSFAFWGHKVIRWMVPLLYAASLGALMPLIAAPFYRAVLAANVFGITLSAIASIPEIGNKLPRILRPIVYFFIMNYALGVGFLRFLTGTQRVTWEQAGR